VLCVFVVSAGAATGCGGTHPLARTVPKPLASEQANEPIAILQRNLERQGIHLHIGHIGRAALHLLRAKIAKEVPKLGSPFPTSSTRTSPPLVHLVPAGPPVTLTIH
jgi:hypothetical protein